MACEPNFEPSLGSLHTTTVALLLCYLINLTRAIKVDTVAMGFIIFLVNKKLDRDNDLMKAEHVIFGHLRRALIECFEVRC